MTHEKQRLAIAKAVNVHVCPSCKNEIDPECCHCGDKITEGPHNYETYHEGHMPIPMGCRCAYDKQPQPEWIGVPNWPRDTHAAVGLCDVLAKDGKRIKLDLLLNTWIAVVVTVEGEFEHTAPTLAEAIAGAFLKAKGLWREEGE